MNLREKYLQEALKELAERRQRNQRLVDQRYDQIQRQLPEIPHLRQQLAEQTSALIQQTMNSPEKKAEFSQELIRLQRQTTEKIAALLQAHSLPADFMEPVYDCPSCRDTGFLPDQGACACLKKSFIARAYQQSNLVLSLERHNFAVFSFAVYEDIVDAEYGISPRENMRTIFDACRRFAADFGKSSRNLLLHGPSGLGKSFLCSCIAKAVLDNGFSVIYLSAPEFFGFFEKYHFHHGEETIDYGFLESLYDCDLLILDDLGTEVISSVTQSDLFQTINRRINEQKCTVISTNFSISQLSAVYSERITSRILGEYEPLLFFGSDIRKRKYLQ